MSVNKLPEIREIYIHIASGHKYRLLDIDSGNNAICIQIDENNNNIIPNYYKTLSIINFWEEFKELKSKKSEKKLPEIGVKYSWKHAPQRYFLVIGFFKDKIICIQDRFLDSSDDEALECAELMTLGGFKCVTNFKKWSESLINALYNTKTQAEPVVANKIEGAAHFVDANKKEIKLPWKDVGEEIDNQSIIFVNKAGYARIGEYWNDKIYFLEGDSGEVISHFIDKMYYGRKYCTLTDLINSIESMLSRQYELEERIKKLEGK
jgi:hypothetical protein